MTRLAIFLLLAIPAHAENCKPPNVARALLGIDLEDFVLECRPIEGVCRYRLINSVLPEVSMICLTPEQNAAAEARYGKDTQ